MVEATIKAATLGASGTLAGTIDLPTLSHVLLTMLGVADVDEIVERLFPGGEVPQPEPTPATDPATERPQAEALMIRAIKDLHDAILKESAESA